MNGPEKDIRKYLLDNAEQHVVIQYLSKADARARREPREVKAFVNADGTLRFPPGTALFRIGEADEADNRPTRLLNYEERHAVANALNERIDWDEFDAEVGEQLGFSMRDLAVPDRVIVRKVAEAGE